MLRSFDFAMGMAVGYSIAALIVFAVGWWDYLRQEWWDFFFPEDE